MASAWSKVLIYFCKHEEDALEEIIFRVVYFLFSVSRGYIFLFEKVLRICY